MVNIDPQITAENVTITIEDFYHKNCLQIESKVVMYIPLGINSSIPLLDKLVITDSQLQKVTSINLQPFKGLKNLDLSGNSISVLEKDLFVHNDRLKKINLSKNKIVVIHPEVSDENLNFNNF